MQHRAPQDKVCPLHSLPLNARQEWNESTTRKHIANSGHRFILGHHRVDRLCKIVSELNGNVMADAFKFVYSSPERITITPTPEPTAVLRTNHPPSPEEQMTSGDLAARLGLVQRFYDYTPAIWPWEQVTFDDCQIFPRDGCGGTRDGLLVQVEYKAIGKKILSKVVVIVITGKTVYNQPGPITFLREAL